MKKRIKVTPDHPQYESASIRKFIIIMICCFLAGGLTGACASFGTDTVQAYFSEHKTVILQLLTHIQIYVLPFVMLFFTVYFSITNHVWLQKSQWEIATWDGEDNDYIQAVDRQLSRVAARTSIWFVGNTLLYAMISYNMSRNIEDKHSYLIVLLISVVVFLAGLFIPVHQQSRMVKLIQEYAPEKRGSVYDQRFQKVWLESCDEAEQHMIYEASYKTFQFMNKALSIIMTVTTILGMFCPIGFLCSVIVGIIWLLMYFCYTKEANRLEYK